MLIYMVNLYLDQICLQKRYLAELVKYYSQPLSPVSIKYTIGKLRIGIKLNVCNQRSDEYTIELL